MTKTQNIIKDFTQAVQRLDEVLRESKTDIVQDAAIKRFEFTFDLAWKSIKAVLEDRYTVNCASPKGCFREAYRQGVIAYDDTWIDMANKRNRTVHTYNQVTAAEVYEQLPNYLRLVQGLLNKLNELGKGLDKLA